ncbi:Uncharacterised protein r2_g4057 [Pycnogonum litorale]
MAWGRTIDNWYWATRLWYSNNSTLSCHGPSKISDFFPDGLPTIESGEYIKRKEGALEECLRNVNSECFNRDELAREQSIDKDILKWFELSEREPSEGETTFFKANGLIFRQFYRKKKDGKYVQLVLPHKFRSNVLQLAHDHPLSGHFSIKKTQERVLKHFYWPSIFRDIRDYCKTCHVCKVTSRNIRISKAPHVGVPSVDTPFKNLGIALFGPMHRTHRGNKIVLQSSRAAKPMPTEFRKHSCKWRGPFTNTHVDDVRHKILVPYPSVERRSLESPRYTS